MITGIEKGSNDEEKAGFGLTSIVVLTWNGLRYTKDCLESVRKHTYPDYELIVVDNGSTDGTVEWLEKRDLKLIRNETNRGYAAGVNQGVKTAAGRNILLLNSDTVVTAGWLDRMLDVLYIEPNVGMVGPTSGPPEVRPQGIFFPPPYQDVQGLETFAWLWGAAFSGCLVGAIQLSGMCLLIKREVFDKIGMMDECFKIGGCEDTDFCNRAVKAGYRLLVRADTFIHHHGGRTFAENGLDREAIVNENRIIYNERWPELTCGLAKKNGKP